MVSAFRNNAHPGDFFVTLHHVGGDALMKSAHFCSFIVSSVHLDLVGRSTNLWQEDEFKRKMASLQMYKIFTILHFSEKFIKYK